LDAGISVPNALRIAGFAVHKSRLQQAAWRLANDLELTGQFSPRAYQAALTGAVVHSLSAPMSLAARVSLLREISTCHAERTRIGLSWTTGLIEPIAICAVGFAVGIVVVGLFLPLVKLVEGLSK
jgi:type II secretory pathway component PulF